MLALQKIGPRGLRGIRKADCMTWWREQSKLAEPTFEAFSPLIMILPHIFFFIPLFKTPPSDLSKLISLTRKRIGSLNSNSLLLRVNKRLIFLHTFYFFLVNHALRKKSHTCIPFHPGA